MKQEWKEAYTSMPLKTQARVLAMLAHDLTFWARSAYAAVTNDASVSAKVLAASNEFLHRVTEQLQHLLQYQHKVYPDDAFLEMCWEYAQSARCEDRLSNFFQNVHDAYRRSKEGSLVEAADTK